MKRSTQETADLLEVARRADMLRWEEFLRQVDYKPGWAFSMVDLISKHGAIAVRFKMLVWDTMRERDLVPIAVVTDYTVPGNLLGEKFSYSAACDFLLDCLCLIEMHEAKEWFRFDGMQCYNPHGESQMLGRRVEGWEWMSPAALTIAPHLKEKPRG